VAAWLADLKTENEAIDPRDPFQLNEKEISKMPIKNYLERLTRELNYNPNSNNTDDVTAVSCLIMTMYHLDLYCKLTGTVLNQYNQHALLLISSAVTHKYFDEIPYSDDDIAIEIGLMSSMKRYKKLECLFLKRIDWGVGATSQKIVPLMSIDVIYKQYKTTILEYFFGHGMNDLPGPPVFRFA
ncbi:MAG TPA: hypothetical protein VJL60_02315, partial [Gammaproteobacteria bacterium]|nr:hypothetical protein [Gammaproteobacteria bacterium]